MSDYLKTFTVDAECPFQDSFLEDEYLSSVFRFAVSNAVEAFNSYWSSEDAQAIIKDDTFHYIWNSFPNHREELLNIAIAAKNKANYSHRIKSLSESFCESFLIKLYADAPIDDNEESNRLRIKLVSVVDKSFDYLSELHKFALIEEDRDIYNMWERISMQSSKDEELYNYLWSQVKREKGAVDEKERILVSAMSNNSLSNSLVAKIAKSSPKRLKRTIVEGIRKDKERADRKLRSLENQECEADSDQIESAKERVAKIESRAMLFVGCNDYKVVESLIDCLSRDNLPWLLPSASGHHWLGQRLNRLIDEGNNND
jgi:hypothetical protein